MKFVKIVTISNIKIASSHIGISISKISFSCRCHAHMAHKNRLTLTTHIYKGERER